MERMKQNSIIAFAAYLIAIFIGCYAFVVLVSGFNLEASGGLGYEFDLSKVTVCIFVLIGVVWLLSKEFITESNVYEIIGNARALHALSVITFVVSVGTSVFSSMLLPVIQEWLNRKTIDKQTEESVLADVLSLYMFITAFICTILILFLAHGWHAHKINKALIDRNQQQSKDLRDAIRVAPPPYFTEMLADFTDKAEDFLSLVQSQYLELNSVIDDSEIDNAEKRTLAEATIEQQRASIRAVLTAFGRLARTYDNVNPSGFNNATEYRANLMLTLNPQSDALRVLFPDKAPEIRFKVPTGGEPAYLLVVDKRLSIKIGKQNKDLFKGVEKDGYEMPEIVPNEFTPDKEVKDALLPVYWQKGDVDLENYNMIGAPEAIFKGKNIFIADTIEVIKKSNFFAKDIQDLALDYFEKDKKGRSIVSLPVATRHFKSHPNEKTSPDTYLGSINLYRNSPFIFSGHQKNFDFFSDFTRPLSIILARKVEMHIGALLKYHALTKDDE